MLWTDIDRVEEVDVDRDVVEGLVPNVDVEVDVDEVREVDVLQLDEDDVEEDDEVGEVSLGG